MNKLVFAFALFALVAAGPKVEEFLGSVTIGQQCANPVNAYVVSSFTVVPFPPTRGTTSTSTSVGTFNQAETIKSIHINVLLNGRSIYQEDIPQSGTYASGQVGTFVYAQTTPSIAPKGSYTVNGGLVNTAGTQLNCWEVSFTL